MKYKSKFITFEGGEAVGKTTQVKMIKDWLEKNGINHLMTREPGGVVLSEAIRKLLLSPEYNPNKKTELLLYTAARSEVVEKLIKPALEERKVVLCDRFYDSTAVYQGYSRDLGIDKVYELQKFALGDFKPDKTILYLMDPELAFKRRDGSNQDRMEGQGMDFHKKVYEGYKIIAEKFPERISVVDASESISEIHKKTVEIVKDTIEIEM